MEYEANYSIKKWAEEDRPREKLQGKGRHVLTDAELIAILIGSGNRTETAVELSKKILASTGNNLNSLAKLSISDLCKFNGIGEAKAISIVAALELGRRRKEAAIPDRVQIKSSKNVFETMHSVFLDLPHEEFWVLMLNRSNAVVKREMISRGGVSGTVVDCKILFKTAISNYASSIIVCHNHPSGTLSPSAEDKRITKQIVEAGKLLGIPLLDHLIITDTSFFSFADEGLL